MSVFTEVSFGKSIIGKNRKVDVMLVLDRTALAVECKYQSVQGTTDEKIPYALQDLEALRIAGCLAYAGEGWSPGVIHTLRASAFAAFCNPDPATLARSAETIEIDHVIAATFGFWDTILPSNRLLTLPVVVEPSE